VHFPIVLSVFSKKGSQFSHVQQKRRVKLIVVGENWELNCVLLAVYSVFREEAELLVFGKYTE
jgi:hypothetical protein